ncbi:type I restriction endonuclease subunit R [Jeotgalibacillus aurantiacus]|uniref:type I restriction endonuclease subunit R n=1 Tax=Jeotgalibacillus aurantiacus TaxID=2763266 RepID=UPI001D0BCDCB|nr:HsdR family type I site-specific deoxyribonuclease [Jeotgalibacillus aurantiacus]
MVFNKESEFEESLIEVLSHKGWESKILKNPSEEDLINNWADILFENNRGIDRLNDFPLTRGEMQQIMEQVNTLRTPLKLNGFINGRTVAIIRDNIDDVLHFGKEVSLKIYDRREIAAGQSRYQIVQQPKFKSKSKILNDRRGDLMLLINGMPVIHIELKRSGVSVSQACNQIEKYSTEGVFTGIYSLIQIFVAMEPEETVYFANPGTERKFNKDFYFHWADFNNELINDWKDIASSLLSIPMAHQLIGFYTVADDSDGVLKVMRSYQYYAANAISDRVSKTNWDGRNRLGGYVWHTTGSGKTMTSFKSAQLIANSKDADKVIFLMDRIELGTQSLKEYRSFADENDSVQATQDTITLISKLKSTDPANTLIVTSIQKMSNIKSEEGSICAYDIEIMSSKRIVFIIDEAHRSTFGEMLTDIKCSFPSAVFFGFTGTPIQDENQKKMNTTSTIFGDELHRYSIADGIRDKNVLGFDPYKVLTYRDRDVRRAVALLQAKANSVEEALADSKKQEVFYRFMDSSQIKMAGYVGEDGNYVKGIEDYLPTTQYQTEEHKNMVVKDIADNWLTLSHNSKFHAILATSSIPEAIHYYRLIKKEIAELKVTCLLDPTIDNNGGLALKEDGLIEIIEDYNDRYEQKFSLKNFNKLKKDIASRLAHKEPYKLLERTPEKQLDLIIVVDQMLTGFDSKWINTLYLDKRLRYENIIQAFSRTNRLFGPDKPFGTIRYYRYPHTMEQNIEKAVKLYSGDKPIGLFVEKLEYNLNKLNSIFDDISTLFTRSSISNFEKLPDDRSERGKFALLFKLMNNYLEAAKIQGFTWNQSTYKFSHGRGKPRSKVEMDIDENTYLVLAMRYKELFGDSNGSRGEDVPFEIDGYLTEIDTGRIDSDYMNSRFEKFLRILIQDDVNVTEMRKTLDDLHKSFSILTQQQQKYANIFLHDVASGNARIESGKSFRDYITEYQFKAKNDQIQSISRILGVDESKLRNLMIAKVNEANINEFGRFDDLKASVDRVKAKEYFETMENVKLLPFKINIKVHNLLQEFVLKGGYDIEELKE